MARQRTARSELAKCTVCCSKAAGSLAVAVKHYVQTNWTAAKEADSDANHQTRNKETFHNTSQFSENQRRGGRRAYLACVIQRVGPGGRSGSSAYRQLPGRGVR